jgi:hypothetical protein
MNCQYDSSFCDTGTEEWLTAAEVIDAGSECTCMDILSYPMNIGTCSSSGVYSPMAVASHCSGGAAVCGADTDGHYFLGDTATGATQFTACDLKCDGTAGHTADIPTDTYQGCEFPQVDWITLAQQSTGRFYSRHMHMMGNMAIVGGYMKSTVDPSHTETAESKYGTSDEFELRGPFSRTDLDGSEGTSIYESVKKYYERSWDQYEVAFAKVDTTTGVPQDIVHYGGHGTDQLWDVHTSSDNTRVAASGWFSGNLTVGSTVLTTVAGGTHSGQGSRDGFVLNLDSDLAPVWAKRWPESSPGATETGSRCSGVEYDDSNNLIGVGYQCNSTCVGLMTKLAAADGSQMWEKVFTDVQHFNRVTKTTDGSGDLFVRGKLFTTTGTATAANPTPFGVSCEAEDCGFLARMSSDASTLVWVRTIEGADFSSSYVGSIELDPTGPYIYMAMQDAAESGPITLDSGTPYAGCKDADGVVTPAYEIDATKMVTSADCPSGSTFVDTYSSDAVWAASANTGVHCVGNFDDNCIMKYHTFTGKPVWAVTMPFVNTIVPLADGTLHAIGYGSGKKFDTVSMPDVNWAWHAELDGATGKGESTHSFGSATGSGYTRAYDMGATTDGDLILTGYSGGTSVYLDDGFTLSYPEDDQENHLFVLKLKTSGAKVKPSCITSTSTCEIDANSCYVNGICYASGETAAMLGDSCQVCDPTQSQTAFVDGPTIGDTQCYVQGVCRDADEIFSYKPRYSAASDSMCQYCDPPKSGSAWSVKDGFTAVSGANPPDDCLVADGTATDTMDTSTGGGAIAESDGAQALAAGALVTLVTLLI